MARPRRIQTPGLLRHVVARGNGRMKIFLDEGDYRQFVHLLGEICEQFALECWSYCVMPNHYHAALRPELPNISEAMRHLNSRYAQWWNWKHARVGHTFQGRFKDQIVQHDVYLLALLRYIALNPVRAGLVEAPAAWSWGSYPALAGSRPAPPFLCGTKVLGVFGEADPGVLSERYVKFVLAERPEDAALADRLHSNERILGDVAFKEAIQTKGEAVAGV